MHSYTNKLFLLIFYQQIIQLNPICYFCLEMDERHWWITSKLLESFSNAISEGKRIIEDFMTSAQTIKTIDEFLNSENNKVLLFCITNKDDGEKFLALGNASIMASLLQESDASDTVVYFLKVRNIGTVNKLNVEQEINCGEIKQSAVISFRDLVQKNVMNLIQKHLSSENSIAVQESRSFLSDMSKYVEMLVEFSNASEIPQQVLNIPLDQSIGSFRKNRQNILNPSVIAEYESYLQEWMSSIEAILIENNAEER